MHGTFWTDTFHVLLDWAELSLCVMRLEGRTGTAFKHGTFIPLYHVQNGAVCTRIQSNFTVP